MAFLFELIVTNKKKFRLNKKVIRMMQVWKRSLKMEN